MPAFILALKVQINFTLPQSFLYKLKQFSTAFFMQCGCFKKRRKGLPGFKQAFLVLLNILPDLSRGNFVSFGEYKGKWDLVAAQEIQELAVGFLHLQAYIDQEKQTGQILPFKYILPDHLHHFLPFLNWHLCITISWQIDQVPLLIDQEMIDQLGFSRCGGCFGEPVPVGKHVNEG